MNTTTRITAIATLTAATIAGVLTHADSTYVAMTGAPVVAAAFTAAVSGPRGRGRHAA